MNTKGFFKRLTRIVAGYFHARASGYVEFELTESRNLFAVLVFSPLWGIPLVPASISLELLPFMEEHLSTAVHRLFNLDDGWGIIGGRFDIE